MTLGERLAELERALTRLDEALATVPATDIVRDAAIQRFEFSFELAWKALGAWLAESLVAAPASPRGIIREAYRQGLISDEARWISLLLDRNLTSHTYREATARVVFGRLPEHAGLLRALFETLGRQPPTGAR